MRAIADRLGAGTMSLYTHVPGKPALIELMIDTVAGQLYAGPRRASRSATGGLARRRCSSSPAGTGTCILRHPWLLQVLDGRPVLGPNDQPQVRGRTAAAGRHRTDRHRDGQRADPGSDARRGSGPLAGRRCSPIREQQRAVRRRVVELLEPALAALMDPAGFPLGSRVGRAAGEYHQSAGDPAAQLDFGLDASWTGVAASGRLLSVRDPIVRHGTLIAMTTIAILGAGKIGEAMLAGLLAAGRSPDSLMFTERYPDRVAELTAALRRAGRGDRRGRRSWPTC